MRTADNMSDQSDTEGVEEMSDDDDDAEAMFVSFVSCRFDRLFHGR